MEGDDPGRAIALPIVSMSNEAQFGALPQGTPMPGTEGNDALQVERSPASQYCVFRTGRELYCLSVSEVEEVVEWSPPSRLPLAPAFLMGIFNLRGVIIPVLDIAFLEDLRPDRTPSHLVVAVWSGRGVMRVGLAADEMFGTFFTPEPLLVDEAPKDVPHCRGMLRYDQRLALALNLRRLGEAFPIPIV
jgi:purine-binding chemotaxis protein CheW